MSFKLLYTETYSWNQLWQHLMCLMPWKPPPDTEGRRNHPILLFSLSVLLSVIHSILRFWIYIHITATGTQEYIFRSLSENGASTFLKINLHRAKAGISEGVWGGGGQPCLLVFTDNHILLSQCGFQEILSFSHLERGVWIWATDKGWSLLLKNWFPTPPGNLAPDKHSWKLLGCACIFQGPLKWNHLITADPLHAVLLMVNPVKCCAGTSQNMGNKPLFPTLLFPLCASKQPGRMFSKLLLLPGQLQIEPSL